MSKSDGMHRYLIPCIVDAIQRAGVNEDLARTIADEVDHEIRTMFGAREHYVPAPDRRSRNQQIIALRNKGETTRQIASRVGVNQSTVSRIITKHLNRRSAGLGREEWNL